MEDCLACPRGFFSRRGGDVQREFLEAVDSLLSDPRVSRSLVVRAYANRYLVVESAGG